jgi:HEAT repeat protein
VRVSNTLYALAVASVIATPAAIPILAQDIAARVARLPDGVAHLQFASRPGVCGDGRDAIGFRKAFFAENIQSIGNWNAPSCVTGPVRVALTVAGGKVTRIRTSVGGTWPRTGERVTDLGAVSPVEASSYFFGLIPRIERAENKSRNLLPAVLADAGDVTPRLTALARDDARTQDTRRQAIMWLGLLGDAKVVPTLIAFARSGSPRTGDVVDEHDDGPGSEGLASTAMAALTYVPDGAGVPALIDVARTGSPGARQSAVFWLGQSGDPRAFATLHSIIENSGEDERVRSHAIFALSHGGDVPQSEFAYLRGMFPRLQSNKLKEQVLMGMREDERNGSAWLIAKARDPQESLSTRKTALFWAGQDEVTPTKDLVSVYRSAGEPALKEHAIFVLSQRDDKDSIDELMRIAQSDSDKRMRAKAMFWLGQKDDPRVTKFIGDRIAK